MTGGPASALLPAAPGVAAQPPDQSVVVARTDDGTGNTSESVSIASNRSWIGSLFAAGDMSVDSMIVCMMFATVSFFALMAAQVWIGRVVIGPAELGGGYSAMMLVFGGTKAARDRWGQPPPGG